MSVDVLGSLTMHPRAVIRHAACALLEAAGFTGRVFPNQEEVWTLTTLPALGVYTPDERRLEQDLSPVSDDRILTLSVDVVENYERQEAVLDDRLDALSLVAEKALTFEDMEAACADDGVSLLDMEWQGMTFGMSDNGQTTVGCVTLTWQVEYRMPADETEIDLFVTGHVDWDLADGAGHPDGILEATDTITLPQDQ